MAGVQQNNRLASASYPDPSPMPGGPITVSYSYDSVGNCVSEGSERKYEWDHAGRLRSFRNQAADTSEPTQYVQYLYDAAGQRVKKLNRKQTGANWDAVVYIDGVLELRTQKRGATTKQGLELHVLDGQKRLGRRRSGDSFDSKPDNLLVLGDHLGSANVEFDWSLGSFVDREEFRPYGETSFGSYANKRYRFTGKERDEESGLNYHGARYYAPGLARWMSPDPKGLVDGVNLYGYVRGNPVKFADRIGYEATSTDIDIQQAKASYAESEIHKELMRYGKFEILSEGWTGIKMRPNQLTKREFQSVANLYGAIKSGQTNIQLAKEFSDSAEQETFERKTLEDIATIMQTKMGMGLIMSLATNKLGHKVIIGLSRDKYGRIDPNNPGTAPIRSNRNINYQQKQINGEGNNMLTQYVPGVNSVVPGVEAWATSRSDVTLVHELIHAFHGVFGEEIPGFVDYKMALSPFDMPNQKSPTEIAEYQTVGLREHAYRSFTENKYREERRLIECGGNSCKNTLIGHRDHYSTHTE